MIEKILAYRDTLSEDGKFWFDGVSSHVKSKYPNIPFVYAYQRPMFKVTKQRFIMLGGGKQHFSIYTTDFGYVNLIKDSRIKGLKFGKSAILFPLNRKDFFELACNICDEVVQRAERMIS